ncbi:sortase domain-containing protein [Ornithinimicrobium sp. W1665]|uniref:class F sortase n=1 Tax=Ornithinimicrobium sp. W1665 TaxID=3416666 RepID=UPI003CF8A3FF
MTRPQPPVPTGDPTGGAGASRRDAARRGDDPAGQGRGTATGRPNQGARWRIDRGSFGLLVGSVLLLVWALVALGRDPVPAAEDFGDVPVEVAMTSTGTPAGGDDPASTATPADGATGTPGEDAGTDGTSADDAGADAGSDDAGADAGPGDDAAATRSPSAATSRFTPPATRPATLEEATRAASSAADRAPVRLQVGAVGLDVPLDAVGVQDDGQMRIPEDADRAGWYRFGPAPGSDQGSAVISGHVDDRSGPGAFLALTDVSEGDEVVVEAADGSSTAYTVVSLRTVAKPELAVQEVFRRDGEPVLQLITCTGPWSPDTRRYTDNLVITAVPVDAGEP